MDLSSYHESKLIYDMSRDLDQNDTAVADIDLIAREISRNVSSSISLLLSDLTELFENEMFRNEYDMKKNIVRKDPNTFFSLLIFTKNLSTETIENTSNCYEKMSLLTDLLQNVTNNIIQIKQKVDIYTKQNEISVLENNAYIKSMNLWLSAAEEKLKLDTLQLIKETYLKDENILPQLLEVRIKLENIRSVQLMEREKV